MCATVIWAVTPDAYSEAFVRDAGSKLGVAPETSDYQIVSSRVPSPQRTFTLTRNYCDCDGLIGLKSAELRETETGPREIVGWLRGLWTQFPNLERISLLRAWSPQTLDVKPKRSKGVPLADVGEDLLRSVSDDMLLTIDLA